MKKNSNLSISTIGIVFVILGICLFDEQKLIKCFFLIVGIIQIVYAVIKTDKENDSKGLQ